MRVPNIQPDATQLALRGAAMTIRWFGFRWRRSRAASRGTWPLALLCTLLTGCEKQSSPGSTVTPRTKPTTTPFTRAPGVASRATCVLHTFHLLSLLTGLAKLAGHSVVTLSLKHPWIHLFGAAAAPTHPSTSRLTGMLGGQEWTRRAHALALHIGSSGGP